MTDDQHMTAEQAGAAETGPAGRAPTFVFVEANGSELTLPLGGLRPRIAGLASDLQRQVAQGSVVGLMFRSEPILVLAWLACLHAGLRPLVMQYPTTKQSREYWRASVANTVERAGLAALLCDEYCVSLGMPEGARAIVLPRFEDIPAAPEGTALPALLPESFAIVQLSSGTTGFRKAVEFRSDDLRRHVADYNETLRLEPGRDCVVSWLPLYHDMGYVACFVMPLLLGIDVVMMDPMTWVRNPVMLFDAVERHRGTVTYMPNFGFEVMARAEPRPLPSVRHWISCSEPVSAVTTRRFMERIGAPDETFSACYAMAENIFAVSFSRGLVTRTIDGREVVSCGRPITGVEVKVVEDELWVRSPTSLRNYMGGDDIRDAEGFYPTGDLGQIIEGELHVTGRKQDLITQAGRKFMLSDIDLAVNEAFPEVKGRVAAVQVYDERLGTQKPLVLIEDKDFFLRRDTDAVADAIRDATGLDQMEVAFVPPRFLTKTSSGKINRKKSAQDWAAHLEQKSGAAVQGASVETELRHYYEHLPWDVPVRGILDSLSLTVLRIILNDAGIAFDPDATLDDFVRQGAGGAEKAEAEYLYIVSLADRGTLKHITPQHIEALSRRLKIPVVLEHLCLPPAAVTLSDLVFQDYFLPRVDRADYAVVERQLNKLRRASLILVDDVAEMVFPPAQVYGALSHNLERDPRADLITVRWQRYPQMHQKLPLTVVSGRDLPFRHRSDTIMRLGAYLKTPVFRIATLRETAEFTDDWEHRLFEEFPDRADARLHLQPGAFMQGLASWIEALPKPPKRQSGVPVTALEMSDLSHFCSRIVDRDSVDKVLDRFDRFCIVGQECSVPYVARRLEELGKPYVRSPSYAPDALAPLSDSFDCILICGAQGRYAIEKPAVALMAADPTQNTWNFPDPSFETMTFVVPQTRAPATGQDWYVSFALERGGDDAVFRALRQALREQGIAARKRVESRRALAKAGS
ncbi:AMP-binding protein [Roseomonas populi]|uniref:AMP-binding protein n=1 Tax=Roseomonas populi TaxID=3121582 RepID=A0ABT1X6F7_9PROT|nr:AMP-binding protein [Roseomonas pecuniae]MCR0983684.1 AMP-binding protein [Roseomonas pecuniae]